MGALSAVGDADASDLSRKAVISPAGHTLEACEPAEHPAALLDLPADGAPPALPAQVAEQRARWAALLRQVAHATCRLPQDHAGLHVRVRRCTRAGTRSWQWAVQIPATGDQWPVISGR
ncbi:hypothetical protein [Kineococcus sp. SYSU DK005]|uniref:hypothetical protein n=1 Tax=Kineococcus sp. SYSU DK005 TaxID=3383126 RepID=UPI003D7E84D0